MATKKKSTKHSLPATVFVGIEDDEFDPGSNALIAAISIDDVIAYDDETMLVGEYRLERVLRVTRKNVVEREVVQEV